MGHKFLMSVSTVAVAAAALVGMAVVAAEGPKQTAVGTKYALSGKVVQADGIGKNGKRSLSSTRKTERRQASVPITSCTASGSFKAPRA